MISSQPLDPIQESADNVNESASSSSSGYFPSAQRVPTPPQHAEQTTAAADHNEQVFTYSESVHMTDYYRFRLLNTNPNNFETDTVPQFGRPQVGTGIINIFGRCILQVPGQPCTKPLTNPQVIQSFRMSIPNNYPSHWHSDIMFIQTLLNTAQAAMETQFPFPFFEANDFSFRLEGESIYYSFARDSNMYFFHRINIVQLKLMEPVARNDFLKNMTPIPAPYQTAPGRFYDACYDIVFLVSDIRPKQIRSTPMSVNEQLLVQKLNSLINQRIDVIATIARLLTIYHDYRTASLNIQPAQPSQRNTFPQAPTPTTSSTQPHEAHQQNQDRYPIAINVNRNAHPPQQQPSQPYVIPPLRVKETDQTILQQMEQTLLQQQQRLQELTTQMYASPYSDTEATPQPPRPVRTKRRAKAVIDPTVPWDRSQPQ